MLVPADMADRLASWLSRKRHSPESVKKMDFNLDNSANNKPFVSAITVIPSYYPQEASFTGDPKEIELYQEPQVPIVDIHADQKHKAAEKFKDGIFINLL
jgi:hypothetical protein